MKDTKPKDLIARGEHIGDCFTTGRNKRNYEINFNRQFHGTSYLTIINWIVKAELWRRGGSN